VKNPETGTLEDSCLAKKKEVVKRVSDFMNSFEYHVLVEDFTRRLSMPSQAEIRRKELADQPRGPQWGVQDTLSKPPVSAAAVAEKQLFAGAQATVERMFKTLAEDLGLKRIGVIYSYTKFMFSVVAVGPPGRVSLALAKLSAAFSRVVYWSVCDEFCEYFGEIRCVLLTRFAGYRGSDRRGVGRFKRNIVSDPARTRTRYLSWRLVACDRLQLKSAKTPQKLAKKHRKIYKPPPKSAKIRHN